MLLKSLKCAAVAGVLWSISSLVMAGTFTPAAGTTITPGTVSIAWNSAANQQWIRAYDSSGSKIFDSGRQSSSTGQVSFSVAASVTQLRVIFYETTAGGWSPIERTYAVNSGSTDGTTGEGSASAVIVSDRISCRDDTIDPTVIEYGGVGHESRPSMQCTLSCPSGELLISVVCNVVALQGTYGVVDGTNEQTSLASDMSFHTASEADCSLYGQFDEYLLPLDRFDPLHVAGVVLTASGACMSLPE